MICFFSNESSVIALSKNNPLTDNELIRLKWLLNGAEQIISDKIDGYFIGPRKEMVTPWSTNAVEITQNMGGIKGIGRMEEFKKSGKQKYCLRPFVIIALYRT